MNNSFVKVIVLIFLFQVLLYTSKGNDSLRYNFAFTYLHDLSDSYGKSKLLSGEFSVIKSWYGIRASYDHMQSILNANFPVEDEELNTIISIPFTEISKMQSGSLSFLIRPFQYKWFSFDLLLGIFYGENKCMKFSSFYYHYNPIEAKFDILFRDYQLKKTIYKGFQTGFDFTFYFSKRIGLLAKAKIISTTNHDGFFFVGSGITIDF